MAMPDLVLFTARFPFDAFEPFLGCELEVTAARFGRVFVVPSHVGTAPCSVPHNVTVVDLAWDYSRWTHQEKLRALVSPEALAVLRGTLEHRFNWRGYARAPRAYLDILATGILKARRLRAWIDEADLADAVFYDYWFENSTLALALLRRSGAIRTAICRAHGFDLYDERWGGGPVPYREFKAQHLDAVFVISEYGAGYLGHKLQRIRGAVGPYHAKIRLSRLGVVSTDSYPSWLPEPPLVVSCSTMLPHKQVHMIPPVLRDCGRPLRWVHFGDGPERPRVEAAAARLPPEVDWELRGSVPNADVQRFYEENAVCAFLSTSATEGIPVSMMEVQRFGVPIVAFAVGGVPEIVTDGAGFALSPSAPVTEIAQALCRAVDPSSFDRAQIRESFATRFDASTNYGAFVEDLLSVPGEG